MYEIWWVATVFLWPIFIGLTSYLFRISGLRTDKNSLSDLGSHKRFGNRFDLLLVISGLTQLAIFVYFGNFDIGTIFLVGTTVMGILTGLVRQSVNDHIHRLISSMGFVLVVPGWILFGLSNHSLMLILWGIVVIPIIVTGFLRKKRVTAKGELFLFGGAWITNWVLAGII